MLISVVIPTYNRTEPVLRLLNSLGEQTLSPERYEVIVVDDGSSYEPGEITSHTFPFTLHYVRQENQGATIARNHGAQQSQGDVLVFIDDDVTVSPHALEALASACLQEEKVIVMGELTARSPEETSLFNQHALEAANAPAYAAGEETAVTVSTASVTNKFIHFSWCNTQLLAVRRQDFFELGMLQDPTGGWPNWDDVDFGYRAHLAGFRLLLCREATGVHWDYSLASLDVACRRWQRASKSAVRLFAVHPGLRPHIPMFHDKTPIAWSQDSPHLIGRKIARRLLSSWPVLWGMVQLVNIFESVVPSSALLRPFYRWIEGGYMFRGYQEGLREYRKAGGI